MEHPFNPPTIASSNWPLKLLLLLVAVVLASVSARGQVLVTTNNGEEYLGQIINDTVDRIELKTTDSAEVRIPKSNVRTIQYSGVDGPIGRRMFPVLGASLGTPSGINLIGGYHFNGWGVRLSGFFLGYSLFGAQLDLLRNIGTYRSFSHNIHVAAGFSQSETVFTVDYWDYLGVGYDLNWHGFFLSAGLSVGNGTYSSPQVMAQIGYVYEFR